MGPNNEYAVKARTQEKAGLGGLDVTCDTFSGYMNTYTPPTKGLSFAQAISAVLEGKRVARAHMHIPGVVFYIGESADGDSDELVGDYPHLEEYGSAPQFDYDDLTANDWYVVTE